jgi:hypothetical protein
MNELPEISEQMLNELFQASNQPLFRRNVNYNDISQLTFTESQNSKIAEILNVKFSVIGFDIFQYSHFSQDKQLFVPFVLYKVYDYALQLVKDNFSFLFQKVDKSFLQNRFISNGDGGFLILETPIHSIIFGLVIETVLRLFNSYRFLPRLRNTVGDVTFRYAITYDNIYTLKNNFF